MGGGYWISHLSCRQSTQFPTVCNRYVGLILKGFKGSRNQRLPITTPIKFWKEILYYKNLTNKIQTEENKSKTMYDTIRHICSFYLQIYYQLALVKVDAVLDQPYNTVIKYRLRPQIRSTAMSLIREFLKVKYNKKITWKKPVQQWI